MRFLLATAGGFGGQFDADPGSWTLAPHAAPKLALAGLLLVLLALWVRERLRSLGD